MAVSALMTGSMLKLTPNIVTKLQREKFLHNFSCLISGQDTNPSASARWCDICIYSYSLNFRKQISQTCRACFYHIRDLRRSRKSLSFDLAKQIAVTLISSKFDFVTHFFTRTSLITTRSELPCKSGNQGPTFLSLSSYSKTITLASSHVSHSI